MGKRDSTPPKLWAHLSLYASQFSAWRTLGVIHFGDIGFELGRILRMKY